jgi:hypothetical protein
VPSTEKLLILANSEKKGGKCVAGKRLTLREDTNTYDVHEWIRPIHPNTSEGEIPISLTIINGKQLAPLDVVEIVFEGTADDHNHPEDYKIEPSKPWKLVHAIEAESVPGFCDDPGDLWGGEMNMIDKVPEGYVPKMNQPTTLLLIQPNEACRVEGFMKPGWENRPAKPRANLLIPHKGLTHEFSITDSAFLARHGIKKQIRTTGTFQMNFADPKKVAFCLSLTPSFRGSHYKIAAAIIELP